MTQKLYMKTYGCQMNIYDSERMVDLLRPLGYTLTDLPQDADFAILNTCHIREKAEQKVFSDLGRLRQVQLDRQNNGKDLLIAVGGCVAQAEGEELMRQAPYVSMVFGPQAYHKLPEMIAEVLRKKDKQEGKKEKIGVVNTEFPSESKFDFLPSPTSTTFSPFLSVQEGCDKFCTYCVVPYTRGAQYSRPALDVINDAKHLVKQGAREITLLGQNVNAYDGLSPHSSHETWGLGRLICELAEIEDLYRIRYTTSHPNDMNDELIHAHGTVDKLMPYLHLPVQSGSDKILQAMNRKHKAKAYLDLIEKLKKACPDIALSSDFIVGFPGETEKDHEDTLNLVKEVGYAQAYSFKYSARPGTPASLMELQVQEDVKVQRLKELQDLLVMQQICFNQSKVGTIQKVLVDREGRHQGQILGKSPFMQSVYFDGSVQHMGKVVDVFIEVATQNSLSGYIKMP